MVQQLVERPAQFELKLVIEVLNRNEAHPVNTAMDAVAFAADVSADNVGILLDAYHMNIEEGDPAVAIRQAAERLWLYHAAVSNRQAIGRGHTDFETQIAALDFVGYNGRLSLSTPRRGRLLDAH